MLRSSFGATRTATTRKWAAISTLSQQKATFLDVRARLDAAWHRQSVIAENLLLGDVALIEIARKAAAKLAGYPLIQEDAEHAILVLMLEGRLEASKAHSDPLAKRAMAREWSMLWPRKNISLDSAGRDEYGGSLYDLIDEGAVHMTKEEFMAIAWRDFILWAHEQDGMRKAFTDATGITFQAPAANALEAMIDNATGVHSQIAAEFVKWVTINHWGIDEAPEEYRTAIGAEKSAPATDCPT